jgi:hypothetical protein
VRSLKELEEAVEECNSIHLISVDFVFSELLHTDVPELEVTEELIEFVMRINKEVSLGRCGAFSYISFVNAWSFNLPKFMKLVVGMVRSSIVCATSAFANKAAMYFAFVNCHTMPKILKLLSDFNPNFNPTSSLLIVPQTPGW